MPAHSRGKMSAEARFGRIIAALCKEKGGELRIKAANMEFGEQNITLSEDWDSSAQEVVIRLHSQFNSIYRILPEQPEAQGALWESNPSREEIRPPMNPERIPRRTANLLEEQERLIKLENKTRALRIQRELRKMATESSPEASGD